MQVTDSIRYVGVNDHQVDLFEGQYQVPNGMSYNSYVILDEKVAVMDTVDIHFGEEWMANVKAVIAGRTPDYGARSLCKYQPLFRGISAGNSSGNCKGICHDEAVLWK